MSASLLADGALPALSEMEFALTVANNAFSRWMVRCMSAAGLSGLTPIEVLILFSVSHRNREKTLSDLCLVLNIEDTHLVTYGVKKLVSLDLVKAGKRGKEKTVQISDRGYAACKRYKEIREELLVQSVKDLSLNPDEISKLASLLRALSGQYDQATRGAASL